MRKVLLVEDDPVLGESLRDRLAQDYQVSWAQSVKEAEQLLTKERWDLAILDIGLPDGDGFQIAAKIGSDRCQFLFLTAQSDAESRLKGFEMGAQEYIPKPFYLKELLMRVQRVLEARPATEILKLGTNEVSLVDFSLRREDGSVEYPPVTDMKILKLLIEKHPGIVSRDEILNEVWGTDKDLNHRTVDNAIVRLRQLLGTAGDRIRSVRGVGYQWTNEEIA